MSAARVFITGGTGYLGTRLIPRLLERGYQVCAVVRPGSERKLPGGCSMVIADPLSSATYVDHMEPCDTFIHLVGVPHPSPVKAEQFQRVDFVSAAQAFAAARQRKAGHFVYVSVAHPAPIMKAYWQVRARCEKLLHACEMPATVLRPWYVLGPGHRWPLVLSPFYRIAERLPRTREAALRLGLVTVDEMTTALEQAVLQPAAGWRVWDVEEIRRTGTERTERLAAAR